jgi:hypothetical protein
MPQPGSLRLLFGQMRGEAGDIWLDGHIEELVIAAAALAILVAIAGYVIARIRSQSVQHEPPTSEILSEFRAAREQGRLSDEEFRTIKTMLAEELNNELNSKDDTG